GHVTRVLLAARQLGLDRGAGPARFLDRRIGEVERELHAQAHAELYADGDADPGRLGDDANARADEGRGDQGRTRRADGAHEPDVVADRTGDRCARVRYRLRPGWVRPRRPRWAWLHGVDHRVDLYPVGVGRARRGNGSHRGPG